MTKLNDGGAVWCKHIVYHEIKLWHNPFRGWHYRFNLQEIIYAGRKVHGNTKKCGICGAKRPAKAREDSK